MNKIYSVVKNRDGNMTVASEIAKGAKKGRVVGAIASLSFVLLSNASYANYKAGTSNVYDPIGAGIGGDPAQYVIVGDKNVADYAGSENYVGFDPTKKTYGEVIYGISNVTRGFPINGGMGGGGNLSPTARVITGVSNDLNGNDSIINGSYNKVVGNNTVVVGTSNTQTGLNSTVVGNFINSEATL